MADENMTDPGTPQAAPVIGSVRNIGEPLRFANVEELVGFSAGAATGGQTVRVWHRLALTSDQPLFHRIVENTSDVVNHMAQQAGTAVRLSRIDTVLLILKADKTAELWLDTAAVSMQCALKRPITVGSVIFDSDIADITGMSFPLVNIEPRDKVLCIFREGWSFGMAFDFNPEGQLDLENFTATLGTLTRELRYRHLYESIADQALFDRLVSAGWFPFVEIISGELKDLLHHSEARFDFTEVEAALIAKFDEARLQRILERWISKPHFAARASVLKAAIDAFNKKEPVAVIKILLTEIEGVLNDAYRAAHAGQGAKLKALLEFAVTSAEQKSGGPNTLMFPAAFAQYLAAQTFANFDPVAQTGNAGSRHAVGHGAAAQDSYTMTRALQAILTLDQLAFYT